MSRIERLLILKIELLISSWGRLKGHLSVSLGTDIGSYLRRQGRPEPRFMA